MNNNIILEYKILDDFSLSENYISSHKKLNSFKFSKYEQAISKVINFKSNYLHMNFFQLVYAYIKKNLRTAQETEDSDERRKQWIKIVFGIVLALGYGGIHVPPNESVGEVILCSRNSFYNFICRIQGFKIL